MKKGWMGAAIAVLTGGAAASALGQALPVDDPAWTLRQGVALGAWRDQPAFRMTSGVAQRSDVAFLDGTIEFDMAVTPHRSFVNVQFRIQEDGQREEFYFRPHKSTLPDAVQYTPVIRGGTQWQLHHGPGGTAAAPLPPDRWIHVRVVVSGRTAAVYLDHAEDPVLVSRLARDPSPGGIGLRGFVPAGSAAAHSAHFTNVVVRPDDVPASLPEVATSPAPDGVIRAWELSATFESDLGPVAALPPDVQGTFRPVAADDRGVVDLGAALGIPDMDGAWTTAARTTIRSRAPTTRMLTLGFSDAVTVLLNGRPLVHLDHSYSFDAPRRDGLFHPGQARVFLPLEQGDNELTVIVADVFGGWALYGALDSLDGVSLTP